MSLMDVIDKARELIGGGGPSGGRRTSEPSAAGGT